jgi:hypothetical protein
MLYSLFFIKKNYFFQCIPSHREIPNTRTPKELAAGDTERTNAAYLRHVSIRAPDRRIGDFLREWVYSKNLKSLHVSLC